MLYKEPTYKKEKTNGFIEGYKFKETSSIDLIIETNIGSTNDSLEVSKDDRILYILEGLGYAKIQGRTYRLEAGKVLEVPAGREVSLDGQFKFLNIRSK